MKGSKEDGVKLSHIDQQTKKSLGRQLIHKTQIKGILLQGIKQSEDGIADYWIRIYIQKYRSEAAFQQAPLQ